MRAPLLSLFAILVLGGCAPATLSPQIIRLRPGNPDRLKATLGMQTGPRLSAPYSSSPGFAFVGDQNSFELTQWTFAYDLDLEKALTEELSVHFGAQGEFYYPFPLPGYGLNAGISTRQAWGPFSVSPALSFRGATDFGIGFLGGPGTLVSAEATIALAHSGADGTTFALVPFAGLHRVYATGAEHPSLYTGVVLVMQLDREKDTVQVMGGFGRVATAGQESWNVPIVGVRGGR